MFDDLLPYYDDELSFIKYEGEEFAKKYPKIAGRIRLTPEQIEDPHVARLIQSVALLNARISQKLDDDFPELCGALLDNLYPHYQTPIPSMSILQFKLSPDFPSSYEIPAGANLQTAHIYGDPCYFTTCYSTTLYPLQVTQAANHGLPLNAPPIPAQQSKILSTLHIVLEGTQKEMALSSLKFDKLRFYINSQVQHSYLIYELIHNNTVSIAIAKGPHDPSPIYISKDHIKPIGFAEDEGMLQYSPRSFLGYRLLTEFFVFPQKFLFFDIEGLDKVLWEGFGNTFYIYFYFNTRKEELENKISKNTFLLGCTPIVNLFKQKAEPFFLTHNQYEYLVTADARRPLSTEINSIKHVLLIDEDGNEKECVPFYGLKHELSKEGPLTYWHATRRNSPETSNEKTDIYISFTDLELNPLEDQKYTTRIETLCTNGNLPSQLPFGGETFELQMESGKDPLSHVCAVFPFTPTQRLPLKPGDRWRLISHLSLTHLSLTNDAAGLETLKEILNLYNFNNEINRKPLIERIVGIKSRRVTSRANNILDGMALYQGLEITVQFNNSQETRGEAYLLSSVLEHFFALYCNINSFTQLVMQEAENELEIKRWAPRAGAKVLV